MNSEKTTRNKRMQFWGKDEIDDSLIMEILCGQKTATATRAGKYYESEEYDDGGWEVGDIVDVYDLKERLRCVLKFIRCCMAIFPSNCGKGRGAGAGCISRISTSSVGPTIDWMMISLDCNSF